MPLKPVRLLEVDPDLGEELEPERFAAARDRVLTRVVVVDTGSWMPPETAYGVRPGGMGLLVLDGLVIRRISLGERLSAELLGRGDVLRPWEHDGEAASMPFAASWRVFEPLSLAVLDRRFVASLAPWPEIASAIVGRALQRSRSLAVDLAITQFPQVETRVHLLLWHLAERWGRVQRDGVLVRLRLSHELLGAVISARRPSVTTALSRLGERGLVKRQDGGWLLCGEPPSLGAEELAVQAEQLGQ